MDDIGEGEWRLRKFNYTKEVKWGKEGGGINGTIFSHWITIHDRILSLMKNSINSKSIIKKNIRKIINSKSNNKKIQHLIVNNSQNKRKKIDEKLDEKEKREKSNPISNPRVSTNYWGSSNKRKRKILKEWREWRNPDFAVLYFLMGGVSFKKWEERYGDYGFVRKSFSVAELEKTLV